MSDSPAPDGGPPVDSDAFHEWVEHTASARDVDEQELLNQLVSAFWVLDEMSGVTGDTDPFGTGSGGGTRSDRTGAGSAADDSGADPSDDVDAILGGDLSDSAGGGDAGAREPDAGADSPDDEAPAPADAATEPDAGAESAGAGDGVDDVAAEIRTLRESLHTQLEVVQAVGELRRQLSDLSLDVENQRSRQDQFTDRISDDLTRLHSRIEELESRTEASEAASAESVDRLAAELRDDIESLAATQREFESWIDEEFDEIEGLFEHVLEATDELDDRLADVESTLETVRADRTERDRLRTLRETAQRSGVDRADCGSCAATVDLSMLDEARCPECDTAFADVTPATGWNPFSKSTLETNPSPPAEFE